MGALGPTLGRSETRSRGASPSSPRSSFRCQLVPFFAENGNRTQRRAHAGAKPDSARARLSAVYAGEADAVAEFVREIAPTVWGCCSYAAEGEAEAREIFLDMMGRLRANNFALVGDFDGRASLESFIALNVRELLAHRMLRLLPTNADKAWRAFTRLFEPDLMRLIRRRIPGAQSEATRQDAYQQIALALIDRDYARLKSYCGSGSFAGFVLRTADRLLIDYLRTVSCRRRLPSPIAKASRLDREVFKLVRWEGVPEQAQVIFERISDIAADETEVEAALARVKIYERNQDHRPIRLTPEQEERVAADSPSPEENLVLCEDETRLRAALNVLTRAFDGLTEPEKHYVRIVLGSGETPPSREIAEAMHRPVEDIYRLKQRVMKRLRDLLSGEAAIEEWRGSV
jgi:RNA polymerase sigma factor (sigma-70 family)